MQFVCLCGCLCPRRFGPNGNAIVPQAIAFDDDHVCIFFFRLVVFTFTRLTLAMQSCYFCAQQRAKCLSRASPFRNYVFTLRVKPNVLDLIMQLSLFTFFCAILASQAPHNRSVGRRAPTDGAASPSLFALHPTARSPRSASAGGGAAVVPQATCATGQGHAAWYCLCMSNMCVDVEADSDGVPVNINNLTSVQVQMVTSSPPQ
jgi:hypothetical protein